MHVHILGVCGTFMGGVAALAVQAGHRVTGADANVYPPMSDRLADLGISVLPLQSIDQFEERPDVVVVGNVMTRGMPAIEYLLNEQLPMTSGPQWLADHVLHNRRVVAVAGTHGKTTTTSLLAWLFQQAGVDAGFLVGGVPNNFGTSARLGSDPVFVVEADEYDSAFFDKRSKFVHYRPQVAVLNNLEFDHADIFRDLDAIKTQFHHLVRTVPGNGALVVNSDDAHLQDVLDMGVWTPQVTFGTTGVWHAEWDGVRGINVRCNGGTVAETAWDLPGEHNASNAAAACAAAVAAGLDSAQLADGLATFNGVQRRMQKIGPSGPVTVYDDFAHHPTAIRGTLEGQRRAAPGRLLAVVELRSNTMRTGYHARDVESAVAVADESFLCAGAEVSQDHYTAPLWRSVERVIERVSDTARPGDTVVVMSNGGFGNFSRRLAGRLNDRFDA
ncbi:MAG: UDP-N-acetylmuramate:L-alanyl-gamma-D-glutamyl-meso-diaminopimelate ligase [Pseudomonadota bacterium]